MHAGRAPHREPERRFATRFVRPRWLVGDDRLRHGRAPGARDRLPNGTGTLPVIPLPHNSPGGRATHGAVRSSTSSPRECGATFLLKPHGPMIRSRLSLALVLLAAMQSVHTASAQTVQYRSPAG